MNIYIIIYTFTDIPAHAEFFERKKKTRFALNNSWVFIFE